jgi:hypothetical protein
MDIYNLISHLKHCPEEFLQRLSDKPGEKPPTEILLKDAYRRIYGDFNAPDSELPSIKELWQLDENQCFSIQIGCWFFSYSYFGNQPGLLPNIHQFLFVDLVEVCEFVKYREWVEDDDRAEEFVRLALRRCCILPDCETEETASDRLDALDTIKRQQVLKESNEHFERIKEIRRKMAEKKAREAANVYGRE